MNNLKKIIETRIIAFHRETDSWFWFDIKWGNTGGYFGKGYIGMLPINERLEKSGNMTMTDNRIGVDPNNCDFYEWDDTEEQQIANPPTYDPLSGDIR